MMSKPLTQHITAPEKKRGRKAKCPVTAMYDPIGARDNPSPNIRWQSAVNRLVKLYPNTINSATGDK